MRKIIKQPIWPILIVFYIVMCILLPEFRGLKNFASILNQGTPYGFIGIGLTMILLNGNIDLSVGSLFGLACTTCILVQSFSQNMIVGIVAAIAICTAIGALNGFLVGKVGITSFVVTLASMIGVNGLTFIFCKEQSIIGELKEFYNLGAITIGPFPLQVFIFIGCVVVMQLFLTYTKHGRNSFVVGGNIETAKNAGINIKRHTAINFAICGFFVGLGGVFSCARINASTPQLGEGYEVLAIAAVVLGGTKLAGGSGGYVQTLGGAILIGMLQNMLNLFAVHAYYKDLVMGLVLIAVIFFDSRIGKSKEHLVDSSASGDASRGKGLKNLLGGNGLRRATRG